MENKSWKCIECTVILREKLMISEKESWKIPRFADTEKHVLLCTGFEFFYPQWFLTFYFISSAKWFHTSTKENKVAVYNFWWWWGGLYNFVNVDVLRNCSQITQKRTWLSPKHWRRTSWNSLHTIIITLPPVNTFTVCIIRKPQTEVSREIQLYTELVAIPTCTCFSDHKLSLGLRRNANTRTFTTIARELVVKQRSCINLQTLLMTFVSFINKASLY